MAAIDFTYQYGFFSKVAANSNGRPGLSLATFSADATQPYFFDGRARAPRELGMMMYTLSEVVRTHYFKPMPTLLDPVLTSHEDLLRLEGFSGCCGVYARIDLPAESFDSTRQGRGTTNVDFNQPMRNALLRLRDGEDVDFAVGKDEVALSRGGDRVVEKKVKLPLRWIKSFSEVQSYQKRLKLKFEVPAAEALRFSRSLPKSSGPKQVSYAVQTGRNLRLSMRPQRGAVKFTGTHRVKAIESLLPLAQKLRVWASKDEGTSAWEVVLSSGSFLLVLSPEVHRGFSGEGQLLEELARAPEESVIAQIRAQLAWGAHISTDDVSKKLGMETRVVEDVIAVLSTRGLAGYDAISENYFHRELPFDLSKVEAMQPRLKGARRLVDEKGVQINGGGVFLVRGTGTIHQVKLDDDGKGQCTCPWYSKHQGNRGPCKHILAAQITQETDA
ncbi:SWIM zinc finger family protein [Algimonas ampicilliniresistens]|uniref:SWIM zinc finger family protein n=1 Tax=Algimonas ampicilliniresistens TaxID=1298735 RepID=UPI0024E15255|nr:SWIM zinc finger family protein [Algimonas ampicilliniresistens]